MRVIAESTRSWALAGGSRLTPHRPVTQPSRSSRSLGTLNESMHVLHNGVSARSLRRTVVPLRRPKGAFVALTSGHFRSPGDDRPARQHRPQRSAELRRGNSLGVPLPLRVETAVGKGLEDRPPRVHAARPRRPAVATTSGGRSPGGSSARSSRSMRPAPTPAGSPSAGSTGWSTSTPSATCWAWTSTRPRTSRPTTRRTGSTTSATCSPSRPAETTCRRRRRRAAIVEAIAPAPAGPVRRPAGRRQGRRTRTEPSRPASGRTQARRQVPGRRRLRVPPRRLARVRRRLGLDHPRGQRGRRKKTLSVRRQQDVPSSSRGRPDEGTHTVSSSATVAGKPTRTASSAPARRRYFLGR